MKTRRGLKPTDALLVGRLYVHRCDGRWYLGIEVWCPYCKSEHCHSWDDPPFRADHVSHRAAHCPYGSHLHGKGYYIGLDPSHAGHNRAIVTKLEQLQARGAVA